MVNRVYRIRKIAVLVALAGLAAWVLPDLAGVAGHLVRWGPRGLGAADLGADLALAGAVAVAVAGVAGRRSWGRWVGRGAGLFALARAGGAMAAFGTVRTIDLLVALAAVVLLVSLPGPDEEYLGGPAPGQGETWRRGLGGWALAFEVALVPALLAPIDSAVAEALRDTVASLWLLSGGLAALAAAAVALTLASRSAGLVAGAAAGLAAVACYRGLVAPAPELGHPELFLIAPAAAVACAAAAVHAFPHAAGTALLRRSPRPIV
jgi:hypothetical protein